MGAGNNSSNRWDQERKISFQEKFNKLYNEHQQTKAELQFTKNKLERLADINTNLAITISQRDNTIASLQQKLQRYEQILFSIPTDDEDSTRTDHCEQPSR